MPGVISIDLRGNKSFITSLKRLRDIPDMTAEAMRSWGKTLEKDMKSSATQAGIQNFTGELLDRKGIEWRQRPKGRIGMLFIRKYGVDLDSMNPHYVSFNPKGRYVRKKLLEWGLKANNDSISKKARRVAANPRKGRSIYVKPHPFIMNGWNRARGKLKPNIENKVIKRFTGG